MFELPLQKRKSKMLITEEVIDKVPCTHILDNGGEIDKYIQYLHKRLLYLSMKKNNSNEVGLLLNLNTMDYKIVYGNESLVSLSENKEVRLFLKNASVQSMMFMHNHPNNSNFSYADLASFADNENLRVVTAIRNDGNIHVLQKGLNFNGQLVAIEYNKWVNDNKGVQYILQHCSKFDLDYKYGRCKK